MYDAVDYARARDVLVVVAAGNNAWDNDVDGPGQSLPASLDLPNIISVAASTQDDQLASVSNYGLTSVDLAAPGDGIGSTMPLFLDPTTPYGLTGAGTSTAAPHVAGAAALLLARNPNLSYAQLKDLILTNVDPLPAVAGKTVSGGRLNIYRALAAAPAPAGTLASSTSIFSTSRVSAVRELFATPESVFS